MDKAGAMLLGMASRWVERIDGCYFNVVGAGAKVYECCG